MDVLFLLIPLSVLLVFALIGLFAWSLWRGQFEDLEREGSRILEGDSPDLTVIKTPNNPNTNNPSAKL